MKVGIVGAGFVGGAVKNAYDLEGIECVVVDPAKGYTATIADLADCDGIFICVPSPTRDDGSCDTSILENVVDQLSNYQGVIISKVTAPPSVYQKLFSKNDRLVHAPEFLVAAQAKEDYINGTFAILGGTHPHTDTALEIIKAGQKKIEDISFTEIGEASLAKYCINSMLATKVTFMNQIYQLCESAGLNFEAVKVSIALDTRQGYTHFDVPGPDGKFGFGGACFPKDTSALLKYAESVGSNLSVLDTAVLANKVIRND
jgi:UDPglucose 6-dehydrogenase